MHITLPSVQFAERLSLIRLNPGFEDPGEIRGGAISFAGLGLAGYLGNVTAGRCVLFGPSEIGYLQSLEAELARTRLAKFLDLRIACIVVAADRIAPDWVLEVCSAHQIAVYGTELSASHVLSEVGKRLRDWLAPQITIHGVMMDVSGMGVLLLGDSGVGKSECAIELIERGHRLVADDAVLIKRISDDVAMAESRHTMKHAMELRGIGLIDVRALFGMGSISERKQVELVIRLEAAKEDRPYERLGIEQETTEICGVEVPYLVIPVIEGKNLSILVEVAAMNQHLRSLGVNAAQRIVDELDRRLEERIRERRKIGQESDPIG